MEVTIRLTPHFAEFIEAMLRSGRFASPDEVVQASLRLLEGDEAHREQLGALLDAGDASDPALPFDFKAFLAAKREGRARRHAAE